jgi:hypothetical protein
MPLCSFCLDFIIGSQLLSTFSFLRSFQFSSLILSATAALCLIYRQTKTDGNSARIRPSNCIVINFVFNRIVSIIAAVSRGKGQLPRSFLPPKTHRQGQRGNKYYELDRGKERNEAGIKRGKCHASWAHAHKHLFLLRSGAQRKKALLLILAARER